MARPKWVRVELSAYTDFLTRLLALKSVRNVRRILDAELIALATGDGSGDTFSAKLIRETNEFMECRAQKAARARWQHDRKPEPLRIVKPAESADSQLPMKEEAYAYASEHGLDTGLVSSWYEWAARKRGMKSWKGSLTGFCRMKENEWKKQANQ